MLAYCAAQSQDVAFNNIHQSLVYLNPSFAGSNGFIRNQTIYRNQWPNLSGQYVTYGSCFDGYIKPIRGGMALSILTDDQGRGTTRATSISFVYAQHITLSKEKNIKIIPSVQTSFVQSILDNGRLNFGDMINMRYGMIWNDPTIVPNSSVKYNDIAAGLIIKHGEAALIGVSFSNLLEPNISNLGTYHLPVRTTIHGAYRIAFNPMNAIDLTTILILQNSYYNYRVNIINKRARGFTYGLGYRLSNKFYLREWQDDTNAHNFIGFLGYTGRRFGITYSYDRNINKLSGNTAASHEISLSVVFKKKEK
ncbi:MAG: PorP/SprF family type IX secretion system membrane protein [Sphingobacteriaceae bacterium]|nr:PorP/SprF family type IX secretion system membrane protein [Sphingobacteriaceae bacterium]